MSPVKDNELSKTANISESYLEYSVSDYSGFKNFQDNTEDSNGFWKLREAIKNCQTLGGNNFLNQQNDIQNAESKKMK